MQRFSFDKRRIKFLFLENIHPKAAEALAASGYTNVRSLPKSLAGEALKAALQDVHFLGSAPAPTCPKARWRPPPS